jgi:hypothetical protein
MNTRLARGIGLVVASVAFFGSSLAAQSFQERQIGGIGITVFRDEFFRGENATFRQDVPDLRSSARSRGSGGAGRSTATLPTCRAWA